MAKRSYISPEDFLRYFRELAEDNKGDDLAEALLATFVIKRKSPGSISCSYHKCENEVLYSDAVGWLKIPNLQQLNEKKQWKELFGEEMYFCCIKHAIEEIKFLTSLPY
jgi:hypothetical protein